MLPERRRRLQMWKRRENVTCVSLIILFFLSIVTSYMMPVSSAQTPKVYVDPPNIVDPTLTPPKTFKANVTVANITDLFGFEFKLGYDTTILDLVKVVIHPFLKSPTFMPSNQTNEDEGWYWLGVSSLAPPPGVDGSGPLVTLTFEVTGIGSCALNLYDFEFVDSNANVIPLSVEDGYFNNLLPVKLYVHPPKIINPDLVPCENFTININVLDVTNLYSWEFKLYYDSSILNGTSVTEGPFLNTSGPTNFVIIEFRDAFNGTHGLVWVNCTLSAPPPVSGNGTLATISFHVEALGESVLDLIDTALSDPWGGSIPHYADDGYFNNVLKAYLYVDPPSIIDPTLLPPAYFNVTIKVANVTDLYDYQFKLGYDTGVLNCIGVIIVPFENETNFTTQFNVDNGDGFAWVNVTYYPPAEPLTTTGPVTLAMVFFQVAAMGNTVLDLYNTRLSDPLDGEILHDVFDGFVSIVEHDVAVIAVVPSKNVTYAGREVYINVTVANQGDVLESFNVSAYYDDTLIDTLSVTDLLPNANTTLTFTWDTTGTTPCHNYTIKAEASVVPYELDTADNLYIYGNVKITMLGDINGDGIISISDLVIAAFAFGSQLGDSNWNPDVDFNGDGKITITDLVVIGIHFGETC